MNELSVVSGEIKLVGSCAFVPQEPWILSTSIRNNITYGRDWNSEWYQQVVSACCLEVDLMQFRDGDLTIVGERGITLSGGQKARISLARAVYFNADIYLLDDPLSSVDAEVAKGLFSIFSHGILSNKTVILVTHQLQFAVQTDYILILDSGKQSAYGKYSEIRNIPSFKEYFQCISNSTAKTNRGNGVKVTNKELKCLDSLHEIESLSKNTTESTEEVTHHDGISLLVYAKYIWTGGKSLGIVSILLLPLVSYFPLVLGVNYYLVWWIMAQEIESNSTHTFSLTQLNFSILSYLSLSINGYIFLLLFVC